MTIEAGSGFDMDRRNAMTTLPPRGVWASASGQALVQPNLAALSDALQLQRLNNACVHDVRSLMK
jgi:hypothetical protein